MTKTIWTCGFCTVGNCDRCSGATIRPGESPAALVCGCDQHGPRVHCLNCGNTRPEELTGWACTNPTDCADAIAARSAANPLREELDIVKRLGGEARRRALMERTERMVRAAVAESGIDDEIGHDVAADLGQPRKVRQPRAPRPTSGTCICGGANAACADVPRATKGGKFAPGHDASLKSKLRRRALQGDPDAADRMRELGWERFIPAAEAVSA